METWVDSELEEEDSDEEHAKMALMANTSTNQVISECELAAYDESDSEEEVEVISSLSHFELESCLSEMMRNINFF